MNDQPSLGDYLHELEIEAKKLADVAGQAAQHHADGDLQWACNLVNLMHYNVSSVDDLRRNLVRVFEEHGYTPKLDPDKPPS